MPFFFQYAFNDQRIIKLMARYGDERNNYLYGHEKYLLSRAYRSAASGLLATRASGGPSLPYFTLDPYHRSPCYCCNATTLGEALFSLKNRSQLESFLYGLNGGGGGVSLGLVGVYVDELPYRNRVYGWQD